MFVLRSAFWLSAAFLVIGQSTGMDMGESARQTSSQFMEDGRQMAISGIEAQPCATLECNIGRSLALGALDTAAAAPTVPVEVVAEAHDAGQIAFPPARPSWAY